MQSLMMDRPLTIPSILEHAAAFHPGQQIITRTAEGAIHRYGYADALVRVKRLANALLAMGVRPGDRVGTIEWSTYRHFELYYAVSGIGAILHTINPRLHEDQIAWMIEHAGDTVLCFGAGFAGMVARLAPAMSGIRHFVLLADHAGDAAALPRDASIYEDIVAAHGAAFDWPDLDERQASGLCYTSGTTGDPKGVLYSHRSTLLHSMAVVAPDAFNLSARDVVMPCAQMYHANAWCTPYAAPLVGARLVLPGRALDGESLVELIEAHDVSFLLGVPTIWVGVADYLDALDKRLTSVRRIMVGGATPTAALIRRIEERLGGEFRQIWGMTEMSPLGVVNTPLPGQAADGGDAPVQRKLKQGRGVWGVELRLVDDEGVRLPHDGRSAGHLQVRGPWVASGYFAGAGQDAFTADGWFDTGDIATIDAEGYLQLTDRAKDVIKSGGEWISSIDLEEAASSHPAVAMAAAVGVPHEKWDERPVLIVTLRAGQSLSPDDLLAHIAARVAKWWVPDRVHVVSAMPVGPTGKILKRELRQWLLEGCEKETAQEGD